MKVYLIGAKNPEAIRMINAIRKQRGIDIDFPGFIDGDPEKKGTAFYGFKVLGGPEVVKQINGDDVWFVSLVTGSTLNRKKSFDDVYCEGGRFANLIHPSVNLELVTYSVGNYIQESVIVQAGVEIGYNSSIHIGAMIGHETKIGSHVFIAHAVSVSGCCEIGDGAMIGTNATILPRLKIGKWSTVGAGAVVTKDVPDYTVVVGNPARPIKNIDLNHINRL